MSMTDERAIEMTLGPQLVTRLHGLLRSARIYDASNQTVQTQIHQLMETLALLMEECVTLLATKQQLYVNGVRIKPQPIQLMHFGALSTEFEIRGLGGLRFVGGLDGREIEAFLRLFTAKTGADWGRAPEEIAAGAGFPHIVPIPASEVSVDEDTEASDDKTSRAERARARRTFWHAVAGSRLVLEGTGRREKPSIRQARRVIQPLVDTLMKDECSILGLTALKGHDEYTYAHCINVSLLSIAIGRRMRLPRSALATLGVAALLHDIGKLAVPAEILKKPDALTREEWAAIRRHPIEGLKLLARVTGLGRPVVDAMRVCLEHHQTIDGKGYPDVPAGRHLSTLSRIVTVADCYDAMTAHRAYRPRPLTGFEALQLLLGREAPRFDPVVLWTLVGCVGLYPAGTILLTTSGFTVVSLSPNPADIRRPFCRVLRRPDGLGPEFASGDAPATWDPMPASEAVVRVIPPEEVEADVEACIGA